MNQDAQLRRLDNVSVQVSLEEGRYVVQREGTAVMFGRIPAVQLLYGAMSERKMTCQVKMEFTRLCRVHARAFRAIFTFPFIFAFQGAHSCGFGKATFVVLETRLLCNLFFFWSSFDRRLC